MFGALGKLGKVLPFVGKILELIDDIPVEKIEGAALYLASLDSNDTGVDDRIAGLLRAIAKAVRFMQSVI